MPTARKDRMLAVFATLVLAACDHPDGPPVNGRPAPSAPASATTRAVIKMDAGHDAMTAKDAPPYAIAPAAELEIEVGEYRFSRRDAGPAAPDAVHVVHGSSGYHRASFSGNRVVLSAASLDAVKGGAFQGFEAGESYLVAVGAERSEERRGGKECLE